MPEWVSDWVSTPLIVLMALAVLKLVLNVGEWKGSVDTERGNFNSFMKEIREKFERILERLPTHPPTVAGKSPMQLTDFGKKVAAAFGTDVWAKNSAKVLRENLMGKESFQVDAACREYIERENQEVYLGDRVYRCSYDFGIDQSAVLDVLRVVLREEILKQISGHRRRRKNEEVWHACPNCPNWPEEDYKISWTEPTVGENCAECKELKTWGVCHGEP